MGCNNRQCLRESAPHLLEKVVQLDIFTIFADGVYDDKRLFHAASEAGVHLVTEVNPRRVKSLENIKGPISATKHPVCEGRFWQTNVAEEIRSGKDLFDPKGIIPP